MFKVTTTSPQETQKLATRIVDALVVPGEAPGNATIVALEGDLGAGKTMFVKGVADHLGVTEVVTSPTFVIEKIYNLAPSAPWKRLVHIDAYRLDGKEELGTIGWDELATDPGNLICIEWPLQVGTGVPERAVWLEFEAVDDTTRRISGSVDLPDNV